MVSAGGRSTAPGTITGRASTARGPVEEVFRGRAARVQAFSGPTAVRRCVSASPPGPCRTIRRAASVRRRARVPECDGLRRAVPRMSGRPADSAGAQRFSGRACSRTGSPKQLPEVVAGPRGGRIDSPEVVDSDVDAAVRPVKFSDMMRPPSCSRTVDRPRFTRRSTFRYGESQILPRRRCTERTGVRVAGGGPGRSHRLGPGAAVPSRTGPPPRGSDAWRLPPRTPPRRRFPHPAR